MMLRRIPAGVRAWAAARPFALTTTQSLSTCTGGGWKFLAPPSKDDRVLLGCVSYDPSVAAIWQGMKDYLTTAGLPGFDFVLFTTYEAQVGALLSGGIDIAWNGPLAHVLTHELSPGAISLGMRDTDCDFATVVVVRHDAGIVNVADLAGKSIATGATDSPQGHIVPLQWLAELDIKPGSVTAFDVDLGKHGDTALGEVEALAALARGDVQAVLLSDMMYRRALAAPGGEALAAQTHVLADAPPAFDHCQFDALEASWKTEAFTKALFAMDMQNPAHTEVMRLEGIAKSWARPREEGYTIVRRALRSGKFGAPLGNGKRSFSSSNSSSSSGMTVGVVGAGVVGLQTIRAMRLKGHAVECFDMGSSVGGVWRENYKGFGVQVPKQLYEFADLPMEEANFGDFPTGEQTQAYIERYADHFGLREHVSLNTKVTQVKQLGDGRWTVALTLPDGVHTDRTFDKLVVCSGLYSAHNKFVPDRVSGQDQFAGDVMHTFDYRSDEQVAGKKVVVVGNGKSAVDIAVAASDAGAAKVTLLSRRAHWATPRKIANLIPFQQVFLSRLGQALVVGLRGPLPGSSPPLMTMWHALGWPLMAGAFKVVELIFAAQYRNLSGPTSPFLKESVVTDFYGYAQVLTYDFRDKVRAGDVDWHIGAIDHFTQKGVTTRGGEEIGADVVIYGTGFSKNYDLFDDATKQKLNVESDGLYLYRNTVHTAIPNLAFVGSEIATIMNITTYGLQAWWLAKLWAGEVPYNRKEAEEEVEQIKAWKRTWMPDTPARASLILLHQTHFHDRLLKDMGVAHRRRGANVLAELFTAQVSQHYDGIIGKA